MKVRTAEEKDIQEMAEILIEEYRKEPYRTEWSVENSIKAVESTLLSGRTFVAEDDGRVVGFVNASMNDWAEGKEGFLSEFFVKDEFQGKGVGKGLLEKAEGWFREEGVKVVKLFAHQKSGAWEFYSRMGYDIRPWQLRFKRL